MEIQILYVRKCTITSLVLLMLRQEFRMLWDLRNVIF